VIHHTIQEWEYIDVDDVGRDDALTRSEADSLVAVARGAKIGGPDGETVLVNGHKRLRAQQVVGVLASPQATLEVLPKIDGLDDGGTRRCLIHMLARVFDLDVSVGSKTDLGWQNRDLLEILIRLYCDLLFQAVHRGLSRRYLGHEDDLPTLRERLDVQRQFTVLAATPQKLACRYEELSPDIALNQIMKATVTRLLGLARTSENQRKLTELSFEFLDIRAVPIAELAWDRVVLDRTNAYWAELLRLAKLLLGRRYQTTTMGEAHGYSLLFEMNTLFEEYVGRSLQRALAGSPFDVRLQGPQDHALLDDTGARRFATRPDIVIRQGGVPVLILDTKWKRLTGAIDDPKHGVGQADVYQMMAYAQVYRCSRLVLLYPFHSGLRAPEGRLASHHIRGTEDARLSIATVSLADASAVAGRLRELVRSELGDAYAL
jgi:5-methylcytosine-specific restriction enzyme subunit McrC